MFALLLLLPLTQNNIFFTKQEVSFCHKLLFCQEDIDILLTEAFLLGYSVSINVCSNALELKSEVTELIELEELDIILKYFVSLV